MIVLSVCSLSHYELRGEVMNWKQWKTYDPYKKLWSVVGSRPWTYIYRDIWHGLEYVVQAQWFFIGLAVYYFWGWEGVAAFWVFYTLGYINGHFFWGKKYIQNQQGKP